MPRGLDLTHRVFLLRHYCLEIYRAHLLPPQEETFSFWSSTLVPKCQLYTLTQANYNEICRARPCRQGMNPFNLNCPMAFHKVPPKGRTLQLYSPKTARWVKCLYQHFCFEGCSLHCSLYSTPVTLYTFIHLPFMGLSHLYFVSLLFQSLTEQRS